MQVTIEHLAGVVEDVGDALLRWRSAALGSGTWEDGQMKAAIDAKANTLLTNLLHACDPSVPVISEEALDSQVDGRPHTYFLIDPIDGTASFVDGFDGYVTQAALMQGSEPVLAAIRAPALNLTFVASKGGGAYCNGAALDQRVRTTAYRLIDNYPQPRGFAQRAIERLACTGYVESGSISLKICRVADGSAEVFVKDVLVRDWDLAAPHLVLQETGGGLLTLAGAPFRYQGSYEHRGLIATYRQRDLESIARALAERP